METRLGNNGLQACSDSILYGKVTFWARFLLLTFTITLLNGPKTLFPLIHLHAHFKHFYYFLYMKNYAWCVGDRKICMIELPVVNEYMSQRERSDTDTIHFYLRK